MSLAKRPASDSFGSSQLVKKQRYDQDSSALTLSHGVAGLQAEATVNLSGHSDAVYAARFGPTSNIVASAGADRKIFLWNWNTSTQERQNYGVLEGHKGAILDLSWSRDGRTIFSVSADAVLASWDTETGQRYRRHIGHDSVINVLDTSKRGEEIIFSGSDDGTIGIWDPRQKTAIDYIETPFPITALAVAEAGNELFTGSLDEEIKVWDLRMKHVVYRLGGINKHRDLVTSLSVSPDGQSLLSFAADSTAKTWNVQPFAPTNRHTRTFDGAFIGVDRNLQRASWDAKGERIAAGSGDGTVVVWAARTGKLLNRLPGHSGNVNDVRFAPGDHNTILSASTDSQVLVGGLSS